MRLSIVIPTCNSAMVLRKAVESIVNQNFTDWELFVIDGASTDDTVAVAESFHDERIKVFSECDNGIYDAMNKGIRKAKGEWLYFMGSDDWLVAPDVLETLFSSAVDQYDVVYGDVEAEHLMPCQKGEWTLDTVQYNRCHQAIFYKASVFATNGLYDTKYRILADYAFNLKWFLGGKIKSKYLPMTIAHFAEGGVSNRLIDEAFMKDYGFMVIKYGRTSVPFAIQKKIVRDSIPYNSGKPIARFVLSLYVYFLRLMVVMGLGK